MTQMPKRTDAEMVALMAQAFSAVDGVCSTLDPDDWTRDTDCPGWSVQDQLAHLLSFEAVATGTPPAPEVDLSHLSRVENDFQRATEREVEARRGWTPDAVLAEFRAATTKRMAALRALDDAGWEGDLITPVGSAPQRKILGVRILDVHFHEQDIRRATGRPGHLDGDVARYVVQRMMYLGLPHILAKGAGAPDGTHLRVEVAGPVGCEATIGVVDGKGAVVEGPTANATLATDVETFLCLIGGRWTPARALDEGRITIAGDETLARSVLDAIAVVP